MYYDVLKYHLVTTLLSNDCDDRHYEITKEFQKLSNNPDFKVNFYYGLNSTRFCKFNIEQDKIISNKFHRFFHNECIRKTYQVHRCSYITEKCGWVGCLTSLLGCINYSKIMNWPYLFVFEDDVKFYPIFQKYLNEAINFINDYQIILLDHIEDFKKNHNKINDYFSNISNYIRGGHAYLINSDYYDDIITWINECDIILNRDTLYLYHPEKVFLLNNKICTLSKNSTTSIIHKNV